MSENLDAREVDDVDLDTPESDADSLAADLAAAFEGAPDLASDAAPLVDETPVGNETPEEARQRARDERGRFAAEPKDKPATDAAKAPEKAPDAPVDPAADPASLELKPPPGWSPTAKAEFNNLPEAVKRDIAKREQEIDKGFAALREYKDLKPYQDIAASKGDSLTGWVGRLAQAEHALSTNPVQALLWLARSSNVHPAQLAQAAGFQVSAPQQAQQLQPPPGVHPNDPRWLQHVANVRAQQQQRAQALQRQQPQQDPRVETLQQRLNRLESEREAEKQAPLVAEVNGFLSNAKDYPWAQNLKGDMADFLSKGRAKNLQEAYDMAAWANPETRNLLIKQQRETEAKSNATKNRAAASNARAASRSVTGSPLPGASDAPDLSYSDDPRDMLRAAMAGTSRA